MIQLGANTVLFGTHDLRTAMECIKRSGYDAAEISALPGMADHLPLDSWRSVATEIRALVEELELPLTAMEVGTNAEDRLMLAYEAGAELGIPVVNVGPGRKPDDPGGLQGLIDHLNAMAEKAEELGVMEGVESPAFGVDMDPSHIHRAGEVPKEALAQVVSRVRHVHIRDCVGLGPSPGTPEQQACGRGEIDLMGYCQVLVDAGWEGPVNLEVIGAKEYELTHQAIIAAESYGYLNACMKAVGGR